MEKIIVRLLADCEIDGVKLTKGQDVKLDKATADKLIGQGIASDITAELEAKRFENLVKSTVKDAVSDAMKASKPEPVAQKVADASHVEVKAPTVDPCGGYVGERKEYTRNQKMHAIGSFLRDVASVAKSGERPAGLVKWMAMAKAALGMEVTDGSEGGFLVFPAFSTMLLDGALEQSVVAPYAMGLPMDTQMLELPMIDDRSHSASTVFGGVQAAWEAEAATLTATQPKFLKLGLKLKKLTCLSYATAEMIRWAPMGLGAWMMGNMQKAASWAMDDAFINGTGAGQPLGLLNGTCEIQVTRTTSSMVKYTDICNMLARILIKSEGSVVWLANRGVLPQLMQMSLAVGTGGSAVYLPANGAADRPYNTLAGYPIRYTEKCPALGTTGDLMLVDLSQYLIGNDSKGPDMAQSPHVQFLTAQDCFRVLIFTDGQPERPVAFTPKNGDTQSPIVTLT